jgi:hypothetical protein
MRSLWSVHAGDALRQAAFAFDAVVFDLASIVGPALASALAVGVDPAAGLLVLLALTGAAIVILGMRQHFGSGSPAEGSPAEPGRAPARGSILGLLSSGEFRRLLVTGAFVNIALSATEVALTAYVRHHHALWAAGPLLAEISVGSIVGSLILGTRGKATGKRFFRLLACYALGLAALTAAGLDAPLLAVAAPLAGLCLGSVLATLFSRAGSAAPPGSDTEAQGWLNSVMNGGASAGAAIAGIASGNPVLALGLAAAAAAIAAAGCLPNRGVR